MEYQSVNLEEKFSKIDDHWKPRIVSAFNDYRIKIVKIEGEFVWHHHDETDELFLVLDGSLDIHIGEDDQVVTLKSGEIFVVPRGIEHKPVASGECRLLLIEPAGTLNTGNVEGSDRTAEEDVWI